MLDALRGTADALTLPGEPRAPQADDERRLRWCECLAQHEEDAQREPDTAGPPTAANAVLPDPTVRGASHDVPSPAAAAAAGITPSATQDTLQRLLTPLAGPQPGAPCWTLSLPAVAGGSTWSLLGSYGVSGGVSGGVTAEQGGLHPLRAATEAQWVLQLQVPAAEMTRVQAHLPALAARLERTALPGVRVELARDEKALHPGHSPRWPAHAAGGAP
jgi:hypothetical protein